MIYLVLVLLIGCSGAISASETALFGLTRQGLADMGKSHATLRRQVFRLMHRPRGVLMTVLITNTAVNVAIFAVSFVALHRYRQSYPTIEALGGLATLMAVVVFGEILPKAVVLNNAPRFAPIAGVLIAALQAVLGPIQWVLSVLLINPIVRLLSPSLARPGAVTPQELRQLVEQSARDGVIDSRENDMLQAIVALGHVSVREVMTPRVDLASIDADSDPSVGLQIAGASKSRLLLVHEGDLDHIRGVVITRDIHLNPGVAIAKLVRPVRFVPEQVNLVRLLRNFQGDPDGRAVVVDEYGGTAGFVAMEDVVERIIGDSPANGDASAEAATLRIDDDAYELAGDLSVRIWAERFGILEVDPHVDTVAGMILAKLGRLPSVGDSVRVRNLTLTLKDIRNRRIRRVLLHRDDTSEPVTEAAG